MAKDFAAEEEILPGKFLVFYIINPKAHDLTGKTTLIAGIIYSIKEIIVKPSSYGLLLQPSAPNIYSPNFSFKTSKL